MIKLAYNEKGDTISNRISDNRCNVVVNLINSSEEELESNPYAAKRILVGLLSFSYLQKNEH
jgi:hypothetical protein